MAYINSSGQMDNALGLLNRMQRATFNLTAAQIIAMGTTPVVVLPAPGAGLIHLIDSIVFQFKPGTVAFTGGGAISFIYAGGGGPTIGGATISAATITGNTASYTVVPVLTGATYQPPLNQGITISAASAFAAGNGTAGVTIRFTVSELAS